MSGTHATRDTVSVVLRRLPVALYLRTRQHSDELMREFTHIAHSDESSNIPHRLVELVAELRSRYGTLAESTAEEITAAHGRGEPHIDAAYEVPADLAPAVVQAAEQIAQRYEEADAFCRTGALLALEPPADVVRLRRWYLNEFRRQLLEGAPPLPYDEFDDDGR